ncbi:hypothetical protein [Bacillus oleivorans]|nr:hypothetical protein [Bacillus oleivorans]
MCRGYHKRATNEELSEAVLISSAMLAGSTYVHMAAMFQSYE